MIRKVLKYDLIGAHKAGVAMHPSEDMERLGIDYYRGVPETIFDCWLYLVREWPTQTFPQYISQLELDDNNFPEIRE